MAKRLYVVGLGPGDPGYFTGQARAALEDGLTPDAVLSDVERAMNALGEVTGQTLREDLTARIFERFCVGK